MGAAGNKELVWHLYSELSRGNSRPLGECLAPDVVWTIIGSTRLSGTFRGLDEVTLRAVIADEDPSHFRFTDDRLSWKDAAASTAEIAAARRDFVTSFGSCSFDEPRDDLRALGWL